MAGVLTIEAWLGGPDQVKAESTFPSSSKTYAYNFGQNITDWQFELQAQTIVVDQITYTIDRVTNSSSPNFTNSRVIGYFPEVSIATTSTNTTYIQVINASHGLVNVTHPPGLYTGPILPDARQNTPLTIVGFTWIIPSFYEGNGLTNPPQINSHRIAKIMAWEPLVTPGDPTSSTNPAYTSLI